MIVARDELLTLASFVSLPINNNNSICYYQIYSLEFLTLSIPLLLANQLIMSHQSSHQEHVTR